MDVFVGRLQFIIQPVTLIVDHFYGLKADRFEMVPSGPFVAFWESIIVWTVLTVPSRNRLGSPSSCRASAFDRRGTV